MTFYIQNPKLKNLNYFYIFIFIRIMTLKILIYSQSDLQILNTDFPIQLVQIFFNSDTS